MIKERISVIKRKKIQARKRERAYNKKIEETSIVFMARMMQEMLADKRFAGMKLLLTSRIDARREQREVLYKVCKTSEEYNRKAMICDIEINLLKEILGSPEKYAEAMKEIDNRGN